MHLFYNDYVERFFILKKYTYNETGVDARMDFKLHYFGHDVIENAPFSIDRPEGSYRYIFFHFTSSVFIETSDGIIEASPGSCIIYEPGKKQKFFVEKYRLKHDYLDFTLNDPEFFKNIRFPLNTIIYPRLSPYISSRIEFIHKEDNTSRVGSSYIISSAITNLFIDISRKIHNHSVGSNRKYTEEQSKNFEDLRLSIYHNPEQYTVKKMAHSIDFSLPYFNQLYKRYFGITPIKDLNLARKKFVSKLVIDHEPSKIITKKLGFSSVEYYYRWFKNTFGMTPTEYIQQLQNEKDTLHETNEIVSTKSS
jgi:AraC-like DNA-binding protein